MRITLGLSIIAIVTGCSQVSPRMHPWQSSGNAFSFQTDASQWSIIESYHLGRVASQYVSEATELLKETDVMEISADKAKQYCPTAPFEFSGGLKAFLIRGVSYYKPAYSIVRFHKESGWIYCFQATWNGEIYIPGLRYTPQAAPIVVLLESRPTRVVVAANVGGDPIFYGVDLQKTWKE